MALRRRRGESDDTFEDHHPHLDWNAIVQVEPDVGVTPGEQWPEEAAARRGRSDPYASSADTIYDVEREEAALADPAAVEAWFNGDVARVVPSTRQKPDPIPVSRPTAPAMPATPAGPARVEAPAPMRREPLDHPPPMPAPLLPPARFDPNAAPFDAASFSRPGSRTVPSRTRLRAPVNPAPVAPVAPPIVAQPPPVSRPAPPPQPQSAPRQAPPNTPRQAPPRPFAQAVQQAAPPPSGPAVPPPPQPDQVATPPAQVTRRPLPPPRANEVPSRPSVASDIFPGPAALSGSAEPTPSSRHREAARSQVPKIQGPHEVRWAGQPRTAANAAEGRAANAAEGRAANAAEGRAANAAESRSAQRVTYTDGVSANKKRDDPPRPTREGNSRGQSAPSDAKSSGREQAFQRRSGLGPAPSTGHTVDGHDEPVFVIELSNEPIRFAQPFRVEPAERDYDDGYELINGLIFIDKPEPLHRIVVRPAPRSSPQTSSSPTSAPAAPAKRKPLTRAAAASADPDKPFSFVSLVGDDFARGSDTKRAASASKPARQTVSTFQRAAQLNGPIDASREPSKQRSLAGQREADAPKKRATAATAKSTSSPTRVRGADSVVYRRDDDPRGTKRVTPARTRKPALAIRVVDDPVERLLIDHQDLQLEHYGPIRVESSLWPPDMHVDSVNEHMGTARWPREEGIEVWIRLPQICDALWGELARADLVSGSTVETWITNNDLDDRILHQMRLSIRVDDAENPRDLLRIYREQAEEFVGYGLDGIVSRPTPDRR